MIKKTLTQNLLTTYFSRISYLGAVAPKCYHYSSLHLCLSSLSTSVYIKTAQWGQMLFVPHPIPPLAGAP